MSTTRRRRSTWGSVIARTGPDGRVRSWRASYAHPRIKGRRVWRDFPSDNERLAWIWLEDERRLVEDDARGRAEWTAPADRERAERMRDATFREFAEPWYRDTQRSRRGRPLAPATMRSKDLAFRRLVDYWGDWRLDRIRPPDIARWLARPGFDGSEPLRRAYCILRAAMREAANPSDGTAPLIERDPCLEPLPVKPRSRRALIPPATGDELSELRDAMPDYTRIAVDLMAVLSLRIGEVCALTVADWDPKARVLTVRHSARRGPGDRGSFTIGGAKNESSVAAIPVPEGLAAEIDRHVAAHCGGSGMLIAPLRSRVMSPNTLREHFDRARRAAGRPDLTPHVLRATGITEAVRQGASPREVQTFGRHADARVSLEHYQRASDAGRMRELGEDVYAALVTRTRTRESLERELEAAYRRLRAEQDRIETLMDLKRRRGW
ncbi:tyrosine-type recombinase/integrase [Bifidobacterium oedipodis]|nr:site-specific integrase [Bifidobacterium sp. DSM 109957]